MAAAPGPPSGQLTTGVHVNSATVSGSATQIIGNINVRTSDECYLALLKGTADYTWWKDRNEKCAPDTCKWLLGHESYRAWLDANSGPLLVSADPGCGKSVLSRHLIDSRFENRISPNTLVCHFFFKDGGFQSGIHHALCALLHQLFYHRPHLQDIHLNPRARVDGNELSTNVTALWDMLVDATSDPAGGGPVIIVLDALDECVQDWDNIARLLGKIRTHFEVGPGTLKLFMTSRPYNSTMMHIDILERSIPNIRIRAEDDCEAISKEIEAVISYKIEGMKHQFSADIQAYLKERLLAVPHTTYLWCSLVFDYLQQDRTIKRTKIGIKRALEHLPLTVNEAYENILARSCNQDLTRRALLIVIAARRPLSLREMQIALDGLPHGDAIPDNSSLSSCPSTTPEWELESLDLESDEDFKQRLRELCGLFLVVYHGRVSFLHQTAREFLITANDVPPRLSLRPGLGSHWAHTLHPAEGHGILAWTCIVYLYGIDCARYKATSPRAIEGVQVTRATINTEVMENPEASQAARAHPLSTSKTVSEAINDEYAMLSSKPTSVKTATDGVSAKDLFMYAATSWAFHFSEAFSESRQAAVPLVLSILHPGSANQPIWTMFRFKLERIDPSFTDLMIAAALDLEDVVKILLESDHTLVNREDGRGKTAITYAAETGSIRALSVLLSNTKVDVCVRDPQTGHTLLHQAVERRRPRVIALLLGSGRTDINATTAEGITALSLAAKCGYHDDVSLLLGRKDLEIDQRDSHGRTALSHAVTSNSADVVRLLLGTGKIDVNLTDAHGRTPLWWAAWSAHEVMVKLLLNADGIDVDAKDGTGRTPLSIVSERPHEPCIRLLVETGKVDVNSRDRNGLTPFAYTLMRGNDASKLLFECDGVDLDSRDNIGRTPLSYAAWHGRVESVRLLLDTRRVDVRSEDIDGATPLWWAEHPRKFVKREDAEATCQLLRERLSEEDWAMSGT